MADESGVDGDVAAGSASKMKAPLLLGFLYPISLVPLAIIIVFWSKLLTLYSVLGALIYAASYHWLEKNGITIKGLLLEYFVWRNGMRLNNEPEIAKRKKIG